ncbi:MAG: TatD family hydrolase, partial [Clostridia bacterium]|nr:TatD family hydrolase [Clostridia bacterium]
DCPYMTPVPFRGKTNMPEYVSLVRDKIQEWRDDINVEEVTTRNAKRFFNI